MAVDPERIGGSIYYYGDGGDWRHGIEDGDVPGYYDLFYEDWDPKTKKWIRRGESIGITTDALLALGRGAQVIESLQEERPTEPTQVVFVPGEGKPR